MKLDLLKGGVSSRLHYVDLGNSHYQIAYGSYWSCVLTCWLNMGNL